MGRGHLVTPLVSENASVILPFFHLPPHGRCMCAGLSGEALRGRSPPIEIGPGFVLVVCYEFTGATSCVPTSDALGKLERPAR